MSSQVKLPLARWMSVVYVKSGFRQSAAYLGTFSFIFRFSLRGGASYPECYGPQRGAQAIRTLGVEEGRGIAEFSPLKKMRPPLGSSSKIPAVATRQPTCEVARIPQQAIALRERAQLELKARILQNGRPRRRALCKELEQIATVAHHEVGDNYCRGPIDARHTMHEHRAAVGVRACNKLTGWLEKVIKQWEVSVVVC